MSQKRAKAARQQAKEYEDLIDLKFNRMMPMKPPANFWTRVVWFISPKARRKALLDWMVKREEARKSYLTRVTKHISHTIADTGRVRA
jgi:hypothetical protein